MTQSTEQTYSPAAGGRLAPVAVPADSTELVADPPPKLRVWASYPDGSSPESIEVTYDADGPVTVELIAGILRALPGQTTRVHLVDGNTHTPGALTRALDRASKLKGTQQ